MKKVILLGDSTAAIKAEKARPETGWGECFSQYLAPGWELHNLAINGRSTRMIRQEGVFLDAYFLVSPGDYVLIQFGHNETKPEAHRHTEPWTSFQENLQYFYDYLSKRGAFIIFISPIARRNFVNGHILDTHGDYPKAMKEIAERNGVPFIEMTNTTLELLEKEGDEESKKYFMNFPAGVYKNYPDGDDDNTHLRPAGAELIASLIASALRELKVPFIS